MTIGSLFSGIGGLELGLERAGLGPVFWQCEIDPFCRRVLAKHWPTVTRFEDVTKISSPPYVDVICGGFPCQDLSFAGRGAGLSGSRSGLWFEYLRIVREVRPRFVVVENVAALLVRGMGAVLGGLASLGYDAEWSCLPVCTLGAPHSRDRLFLIAHTDKVGCRSGVDSMPDDARLHDWKAAQGQPQWEDVVRWVGETVSACDRDSSSAAFRGVDDGLSNRLDRLRALGNAVVPQCAEVVGRMIRSTLKADEVPK